MKNSSCKFVRKNGDKYEFGHIEIENIATPKEKRNHIVAGTADSYEAALQQNEMATASATPSRRQVENFRDLY